MQKPKKNNKIKPYSIKWKEQSYKANVFFFFIEIHINSP